MKGDRLITPYSLRGEMLEKIYGSQLGVENVSAGQERFCSGPI